MSITAQATLVKPPLLRARTTQTKRDSSLSFRSTLRFDYRPLVLPKLILEASVRNQRKSSFALLDGWDERPFGRYKDKDMKAIRKYMEELALYDNPPRVDPFEPYIRKYMGEIAQGGGGDGGNGSQGSSRVDRGLARTADRTLQVVLSTFGFFCLYIFIINGEELFPLARDYVRYLTGGPGLRKIGVDSSRVCWGKKGYWLDHQ